jgi:FG-GAP repeat
MSLTHLFKHRSTILIGCQYDDAKDLNDSGSVFVYVRSSSVWTLQATLQASDTTDFNKFGSPSDKAKSPGSIYIFSRSGTVWSQQAKIVPSDLGKRGNFGDSVAIDGTTVIAGDWGNTHIRGAVYVFTGSGATWTQQAKLVSTFRTPFEFYSWSVALEGDTIAVGGWFNNFLKGNIYVWTRDFTIPGHAVFGLFGSAVSISNGNIAAGAMLEGVVYYLPATV